MKNYIILIIFIIISISFLIWSICIEPSKLEIKRYTIKDDQLKGLKIVFASDFHFKKNQTKEAENIIKIINEQNADLVLLGGDFINGHKEKASLPIKEIAKHFSKINSPTYTVLGNHDYWAGNTKITKEFEQYKINVLSNNNKKIIIKNKTIYIAGVQDLQTGYPDINKAIANTKNPTILITHSPDIFPEIWQDINLTLAGHVHGGQIRIPPFGAIIIPSKYGNKYSQGLIVENDKKMIVTKGIGTSILPLRFNCKPEIVVITFE